MQNILLSSVLVLPYLFSTINITNEQHSIVATQFGFKNLGRSSVVIFFHYSWRYPLQAMWLVPRHLWLSTTIAQPFGFVFIVQLLM
jgi:hypothetical protein